MWTFVRDLVVGEIVGAIKDAVTTSWQNSQDAWNRDYLRARYEGQNGVSTSDRPSTVHQYLP
jgi:hypothetical protein